MFFLCLNSRSRDLKSPNLAHMTILLIFMLIPNFNFLGFIDCWLYANQSSSAKIREQKQTYYALTRKPNYLANGSLHFCVRINRTQFLAT